MLAYVEWTARTPTHKSAHFVIIDHLTYDTVNKDFFL